MISLIFFLEKSVILRKLPWFKGFWVGGIGFGFGSLLLLIAQAMTDATTAALAAAAMPIFAVGLEVALDGRRLSARFLLAVALVLFGGALAAGVKLGESSISLGFALGLLASGIFAWGSRETVKSFPSLSPLTRTAVTTSGMFGFVAIPCLVAMFFQYSWSAVGALDISNVSLHQINQTNNTCIYYLSIPILLYHIYCGNFEPMGVYHGQQAFARIYHNQASKD